MTELSLDRQQMVLTLEMERKALYSDIRNRPYLLQEKRLWRRSGSFSKKQYGEMKIGF